MLSYIQKLNWSRSHLEKFEAMLIEWFKNPDNYSASLEPDPDESPYFFVKVSAGEIPATPFSCLVGDVVQNLRNGLDHLAFSLGTANSGTLPKDIARQSQFPIFGDEDRKGRSGRGSAMFRDHGLRMIQAIAPKAQAIIEGLQPYQRGKDFALDPLWRLAQLSNIDKHRSLHLVAAVSAGMAFRPKDLINCQIGPGDIKVFSSRVIESGTPIARLPLRPIDPDREMSMNPFPAIDVVFSDGALKGQSAARTLAAIYTHIAEKVHPPLVKFLT